MLKPADRPGTTLMELLITLSVLGTLLSIALPGMRSGMDALSARAAREAAFGLFSRARIIALQNGGAAIELRADQDRMTVRTPSGAIAAEEVFAPHNINLVIEGADSVTLRYDGHGLGRMMSRTIVFEARAARAGLTISSFGRVRRW